VSVVLGQAFVPAGTQAGALNANEGTRQLYTLNNGVRGAGTSALAETGMQHHGAYGTPSAAVGAWRYFQGEAAEAQADGMHEIAYKNNGGSIEQITAVYLSAGPKLSSTYYGGGNFDGTALWLTPARFNAGGSPSIGSVSPPTVGLSPADTAATGVDVRRLNADLTLVPVTTGAVTTNTYLFAADVYVPANAPASKNVRVGLYADRGGGGLFGTSGNYLAMRGFASGVWSKVEIRITLIISGGTLAANTDDYATAKLEFYINGALSGATQTSTTPANDTSMRSQTGPVRFSPSIAIARGWQSDVPDAFLDNITVSEILPRAEGSLYWQE
jgi:hypothetical protein